MPNSFLSTFQKYTSVLQVDSRYMSRFLVFFMALFSLLSIQVDGQVLENYSSKVGVSTSSRLLKPSQMAEVTLDIKSFPGSNMRFKIPGGSTVFLDEFLWFYAEKDTLFSLPLSDFEGFLKESYRPQMDLTIVNKSLDQGAIEIQKGYFDIQVSGEMPQISQGLMNERRVDNWFKDFFFLALITVLFLFALFRIAFPILLSFITSPQIIFSAEDFSDSGSLQKFFSLDVIFYLLVVCMTWMLSIMFVVHVTEFSPLYSFTTGPTSELMWYLLLGSVFLTLLTVLKFVFLRAMALVFDMQKFEFTHFFYLLRIISLTVFGAVLVIAYFYLNHPVLLEDVVVFLLKAFFWIYIGGIAMLFLLMLGRVNFKNYHLFAYICTAELLPFLIISKMIMG